MNDFETVDLIRITFFLLFGLGSAFMILTNYIAFRVLRPPKKLGFLWWHVTSISLSFLLIGAVALSRAAERLAGEAGAKITWHTFATGFGFLLFAIAQAIIFQVESQRYSYRRAMEEGRKPDVSKHVW